MHELLDRECLDMISSNKMVEFAETNSILMSIVLYKFQIMIHCLLWSRVASSVGACFFSAEQISLETFWLLGGWYAHSSFLRACATTSWATSSLIHRTTCTPRQGLRHLYSSSHNWQQLHHEPWAAFLSSPISMSHHLLHNQAKHKWLTMKHMPSKPTMAWYKSKLSSIYTILTNFIAGVV